MEFVVVHYVCGVFYSCIRCKPIFIRRSPLWLGSWSSYLRVHELRFQMNFLFCGAQAMKSGIKCLKARLNKAVVLFLDLKTCYEHCFEREREKTTTLSTEYFSPCFNTTSKPLCCFHYSNRSRTAWVCFMWKYVCDEWPQHLSEYSLFASEKEKL